MTIDWDKPIETYCGHTAKVISDDYRTVDNYRLRVVQVDFKSHSTVWYGDSDGSNSGGGKIIRNRKTKREGWVNVYSDLTVHGKVWETEEKAKQSALHKTIATAKIEWEE